MIRIYINDGKTRGAIITDFKENENGIYQDSKYLYTEAGDIERWKVEKWEYVREWSTKGSGGNPNSQ